MCGPRVLYYYDCNYQDTLHSFTNSLQAIVTGVYDTPKWMFFRTMPLPSCPAGTERLLPLLPMEEMTRFYTGYHHLIVIVSIHAPWVTLASLIGMICIISPYALYLTTVAPSHKNTSKWRVECINHVVVMAQLLFPPYWSSWCLLRNPFVVAECEFPRIYMFAKSYPELHLDEWLHIAMNYPERDWLTPRRLLTDSPWTKF